MNDSDMSQGTPPLPPLPPLPMQPIDYRGGMGPINYAQPMAGRPGIITAIGTLSIVFACVGIIGSGLLTLYVGFFAVMAQGMRGMANTTAGGGTVMASGTGGASTRPATQPGMTLTPAQVQAVISAVQAKITGGTLSPQQLSALSAELSVPAQQLVDPNMGVPPNQQVISAAVMPDSSIDVWFFNGSQVDLSPTGQATVNFALGSSPWAAARSIFNVSTGALGLTLLGVGSGFLLAVYLLVAGIMTLRQSPRGAFLHWIYVGLKVVSTACVAAGITWLFHSVIEAFGRATTQSVRAPSMSELAPATLVIAGLGLLYPIVLVILLRTRAAREYYRTGAAGQ